MHDGPQTGQRQTRPSPISSCSRMPTLITRSGCRAAGPPRSRPRRSRRARLRRAGPRRAAPTTGTKRVTHGVHGCAVASGARSLQCGQVRRAGPGAHAARSSARESTWATTRGRPARGGEGRVQGLVVAAVDGGGGPARPPRTGPRSRRARISAPRCRSRRWQRFQPAGPAYRDRLVVAALVQFAVADQHAHPRMASAPRAQSECRPDPERQSVPQRPTARSPRPAPAPGPGGGRAASRRARSRGALRRGSPSPPAPRSRPSDRGPSTGGTGHGPGRPSRRDAPQDPVVQDPQDVQRGGRRRAVLLVASSGPSVGAGRGSPAAACAASLQPQVNFMSSRGFGVLWPGGRAATTADDR